MIKILVSIVNYNSYADSLKVMNSVINSIDSSGCEICFLVVDNSSDVSGLNDFFVAVNDLCKFQLIRNIGDLDSQGNYIVESDNNGFGAANNIVLNFAENVGGYDAIWLLNNDLELDKNCLAVLRPYLVSDDFPVLGSTIYETHGPVLGTVSMSGFKGYGTPKNVDQLDEVYAVDAAIGTSMFIKPKFVKGLRFDEDFFMYVEENDFCYRLSQIGAGSYMVKSSHVFHEGGKTFGKNQAVRWYYKVRNLLLFKSKSGSKNILLIPYLLLVTLKSYPFNYKFTKAYLCGVFDFCIRRFGKTGRKF